MKVKNDLKSVFRLALVAMLMSMAACSDGHMLEDEETSAQYSLTLSAGNGGGVSTRTHEYQAGEEVTVTAVPDEGYAFRAWLENGETVSENPVYHFTMPPRNVSLSATFSEISEKPDPNPEPGSSRCLVVYYTWSGNSRSLANDIGGILGCDVIQVELTTPYTVTTDRELYPIAQAEIEAIDNNGTYPSIKTTVENMDDYDVVLVGYPLWYSRMATPMQAFLHNHAEQFAGKAIALFCTSASSGISGTVADARRLCPGSTLTEALWVRSSAIGNAHDSIVEWLARIGLIHIQFVSLQSAIFAS